jgi:hypothetical protein
MTHLMDFHCFPGVELFIADRAEDVGGYGVGILDVALNLE